MENWEAVSRHDLKRVRLVSIALVFLHLVITACMMVMGFSPANTSANITNVKIPPFSLTIVVAAFVALITVIWAAVSAYEVVTGSLESKAVPDWSWHNRHFLFAIIHLFVLAVCLVPSITLFLLRSIGSEFWELLLSDGVPSNIKGTAIFHCVLLCLMLITSACSVIIPTLALGDLHKAEQANEQANEDEDVAQPVPGNVKAMVGFKMLVDVLLAIDIIVMMSQTGFNSSLFICLLVVILFLCVFSYRTYRLFFSVKICDFENWLEFWRYITCANMFCEWCVWWLVITAFLLLGIKKQEFIAVLISTVSPESTAIIISMLILLVCVVGTYTYLLYLHTKCMNTQNDVYSTKLMEKFNKSEDVLSTRTRVSTSRAQPKLNSADEEMKEVQQNVIRESEISVNLET